MYRVQLSALGTLGLSLLIAGLVAGSLAGCAGWLRQPSAETPTVVAATRTSSSSINGPDSATPSNNPAAQAADTQVAGTPTEAPAANVATAAASATVAPSGTGQAAQIDQSLATLQAELNNTDTVPEAAYP